MATGNSTVKVNIIGDAKGLQKELGKADKGLAGLGSSVNGLVAGAAFAGAAVAVLDFGNTAVQEADRLGDATTRLELQLGGLSQPLEDAAAGFSDLGLSAQDFLELSASFADVATAIGLADDQIASFADDAAATAAAIALLGDLDAPAVMDLIGKAAGGSEKALKALGISLTDTEVEARALADTGKATADTLTDSELAAASYALVLEKLKPKLDAVASSGMDAEKAAAAFDAKLETLTGKIGTHLEGPLADLLSWTLAGVEGWEMLADDIGRTDSAIRRALGPAAQMAEILATIATALGAGPGGLAARIGTDLGTGIVSPPGAGGGGGGGFGPSAPPVTIVVQPNAAAEVERSVINALRDHNRRNGVLP